MTRLEDALSLAERGWSVFPCHDAPDDPEIDKTPMRAKGFHGATLKPRVIEILWGAEPNALIGVAMRPDTVALDVDNVEEFEALGLVIPDGPSQQSRSGGYHRLFKSDGRPVRQTVKEVPGADTRVGGLGYVIAWEPGVFPTDPSTLPDAPEWLYGDPSEAHPAPAAAAPRNGHAPEVKVFRMGERDNAATSFAGSMRRAGAGPDAIRAALRAMRDSGQIEQTREDPFTNRAIDRIAGSIGVRGSEAVEAARRKPVERHYATDLLEKELRELEYPVAEILPEGLGVVAGAPKVGKSWLTFQAALELCIGGTLLGRPVDEPRPVLYYGLEDGERRFQKRLRDLIGARRLDISLLELRYDAPAISEGLEDDIRRWLDDNEGGVVFVDVLAKVRPQSKGKGNAYDEDYAVIGPLQTITKERPGTALVVVTHDRKAGSEDFLTTVTGTRGITGAADWVWVIKRERLALKGTIFVTGRDIERDSAIEANFTGNWSALPSHTHAKSFDQDLVLDALRTAPDGNATAQELAGYLNPDYVPTADAKLDSERQSASDKANALVDQGLAQKVGKRPGRNGGIIFHAISEAERKEMIDAAKARSREVMSDDVLTINRLTRQSDGVTVVTRRGGAEDVPFHPDEVDGVTTDAHGVTHGVTPPDHPHVSRGDHGESSAEPRVHAPPRESPVTTVTTVTPSARRNDGVTVVTSPRSRAPAHTHVRVTHSDDEGPI